MRIAAAFVVAIALLTQTEARAADAAFQQWLQSLWPEAQALGVALATFEAVVRGLEPDNSLPDLAIPGRLENAPAASRPRPSGAWLAC